MKKERIDNSTNTRAEEGNFVSDKERIKQLEEQVEKLERIKDRFKRKATDIWADFQEKQKVNLEIAQRVVELNNKPVAEILQNMYFGRTQGDSVEFCEIFGLIKTGWCKDRRLCTDCIDDFLMEHYKERFLEHGGQYMKEFDALKMQYMDDNMLSDVERELVFSVIEKCEDLFKKCEQRDVPASGALLITSDGYSINESCFPDVESARKEMAKQYRLVYPYSNDEDADEITAMSSLREDEAILYNGGENVYLWKVVNLKEI